MPYEGDDDWDDHSRFTSYWNDLKYNSDSYYDKTRWKKKVGKSSKPQEASSETSSHPSAKRQKVRHSSHSTSPILLQDDIPPVLWVSQKDRGGVKRAKAPAKVQPASVLANWRERFADRSGFPSRTRPIKLVEVPDAGYDGECEDDDPRAEDLYAPPATSKPPPPAAKSDQIDSTQDGDPGGPTLDPNALKAALRQHLAAAGIPTSAIDESTLLSFATRMFSQGSEGGDDILSELTTELLGHEDEDNEEEAAAEAGGFAGWIASQVESKTQQQQQMKTPKPSELNGAGPAAVADESLSAPRSPTKRKVDDAADEVLKGDMPVPKRAARSFGAPTQASRARATIAAARGGGAKGKGRA